jgi:hypothetical protein
MRSKSNDEKKTAQSKNELEQFEEKKGQYYISTDDRICSFA